MGQSPPSKDCNEQGDGLPFYQDNAEFGPKYPSPQKWCNRPKKIADEGDILISVRAPVGEINIAPHKCCIGRGIAAVKAKDVDDGFLYQSVLWRRKALQKIAQGSTSQAINYRELSEMLILLPPPAEQKKIAEILTTLGDPIEKTAKIIEKTKVLKKGLMQRPVKKQKKVDEVLDPVDDDIEKESNYKEQLKSLKKGLMQVLFTGKLRLEV